MAYNLPPAWDPGFVLPKNVRDEGLQRRAFITKMLPRGSYSQPKVGTGGYAVPEYVMDEGYGQGTYTTYWQPGGTYNGPRIPNWLNRHPKVVKTTPLPGGGKVATIQSGSPPVSMGDAPLPDAFADYGQKAAALLLAHAAALPPNRRAAALKATLDKLDKSLWSRTQDIWARYRKQGMPAADAFQAALARAMGAGIAAEIVSVGLKGTAPQANSLLGLGCYGPMPALGATPDSSCRTTAGYSWVYGANGVSGHWEKTPAGQADVPACATMPPGARTVADEIAAGTLQVSSSPTLTAGPFLVELDRLRDRTWNKDANRNSSPDLLYPSPDPNVPVNATPSTGPGMIVREMDPAILKWFGQQLMPADIATGKYNAGLYTDMQHELADDWGSPYYPDVAKWMAAFGVSPTTKVRRDLVWGSLGVGFNSWGHFKDPNTGKDMALYAILRLANVLKPWDATANPLVLKVWLVHPADKGLLGSVMDVVNTIADTGGGVINGAIDGLSNLACDLLKSPVANAGAAVAAGAAGVPPAAGVAGVAVAKQACGTPPPPKPPGPPASSNLLPLAILGGGAVLALLLVATGRKSTS